MKSLSNDKIISLYKKITSKKEGLNAELFKQIVWKYNVELLSGIRPSHPDYNLYAGEIFALLISQQNQIQELNRIESTSETRQDVVEKCFTFADNFPEIKCELDSETAGDFIKAKENRRKKGIFEASQDNPFGEAQESKEGAFFIYKGKQEEAKRTAKQLPRFQEEVKTPSKASQTQREIISLNEFL